MSTPSDAAVERAISIISPLPFKFICIILRFLFINGLVCLIPSLTDGALLTLCWVYQRSVLSLGAGGAVVIGGLVGPEAVDASGGVCVVLPGIGVPG